MRSEISKSYFLTAKVMELVGFVGIAWCYIVYGVILINLIALAGCPGLKGVDESLNFNSNDFWILGLMWPLLIIALLVGLFGMAASWVASTVAGYWTMIALMGICGICLIFVLGVLLINLIKSWWEYNRKNLR